MQTNQHNITHNNQQLMTRNGDVLAAPSRGDNMAHAEVRSLLFEASICFISSSWEKKLMMT